MRAFVPRSLAFAVAGFAAILAGQALAQANSAPSAIATPAAEQPEEVTVRGQRSLPEYRLALERARSDIVRIFNDANEGTDTDVRCRGEQPTGSRVPRTVCRSEAENRANAEAGRRMLNSLFLSAQGSFARLGFGGPPAQSYSNVGPANTEQAGKVGAADALSEFEAEFVRILSENRDLYTAVTTYVELEGEYAVARGDTVAAVPDLMRGAPPAEPTGPQCEATTLTEYSQRNNTALVSGTVSISNCPAGTTGGLTLVARVRNDAGDVTPIEFKETWQRADAEDHKFQAEYPIGENVFLQSVRARDLQCTCAAPAQ
jgi:hypothetical protein